MSFLIPFFLSHNIYPQFKKDKKGHLLSNSPIQTSLDYCYEYVDFSKNRDRMPSGTISEPRQRKDGEVQLRLKSIR